MFVSAYSFLSATAPGHKEGPDIQFQVARIAPKRQKFLKLKATAWLQENQENLFVLCFFLPL